MPAVYTRTGDKGGTGLFGGSRVEKQSPRVEAYGTLDEANSVIGLAKTHVNDTELRTRLHDIQQRLFTVAAELASDNVGAAQLDNLVGDDDVAALERLIDRCLAETGPQRQFVVPGRDEVSAGLHVARTLVRRAERRVLTARETSPVRIEVIMYLNRLSDTLYALARVFEERFTRDKVEKAVRDVVGRMHMQEPARALSTLTPHTLDLEAALVMAEAAKDKAQELGVPIVCAVSDGAGNPLLLHRMPDSLLGSIALAGDKAWTSVAFRQPTGELRNQACETGPLFGLQSSSSGRICVFGGGLPIFLDGRLQGGIGISGGTVEQDEVIADHALKTLAQGYKEQI
ncbi:MAG: cob(I)yrinic acid a,c-diamide adenosyltransferase [Arachnia sp.]